MERRITVLAIGARGDVQPLIGLGRGLAAAGNRVRIATHETFRPLVVEQGLAFALLDGDPVAEFHRALQYEPGPLRQVRSLIRAAARYQRQWMASAWTACGDTDAIIVSLFGGLVGTHVADRRQVPLIRAYSNPVTPTCEPIQVRGSGSTGRLKHRLSLAFIQLAMYGLWQAWRPLVNAARREILGLPSLSGRAPFGNLDGRHCPLLYGYSPAVFPRPADWGQWIHVTGYWFLPRPDDWRPTAELVDFVERGQPPVFVGFGSNPQDRGSATRTRIILAALRQTGQRAVLVRGSGALDHVELSDNVLMVDSVPYDWLFPRMTALIHHGGAGTTAWGLRAGIPTITIPSVADQPFWAEQVHRIGVGPPPIKPRTLDVDPLAAAIQTAVHDPDVRARAQRLGERIRAETGVERGVELIDRQLAAA